MQLGKHKLVDERQQSWCVRRHPGQAVVLHVLTCRFCFALSVPSVWRQPEQHRTTQPFVADVA